MKDILDDPVRISDQVSSAAVGDETVMLHLGDGMYYGLDAVGTWIWNQLASGMTARRISAEMADSYSIPVKQAEADLRDFLTELYNRELLVGRAD